MKHHWPQIFLIPFTLLTYVATILILPIYRPTGVRFYAGCIEFIGGTFTRDGKAFTRIWGRPGGQSWGVRCVWYSSRHNQASASLRVHERVHALHGEWVNAAAHLALVPAGLALGGWWIPASILVAQLAFAIAYVGHFLYHWMLTGFGPWYDAYRLIWSERIAYRIQDEFENGTRPDAWGNES